ncbi:MAG: hypothetical protein KF886_15830 [Candidatus Hydrogenedentes bacterium]|nr:hypothetical protein [Candidatus Hydrogenedentota bacterium]
MNSPTVTITITPEERDIILNYAELPKGVAARLRFAIQGDAELEVRLSEQEQLALAQSLYSAIDSAPDSDTAFAISHLISRVAPLEIPDMSGEFDRSLFPPDMPDEICREIYERLHTGEFESLEDAFEAVEDIIYKHNAAPLDAYHGLSTEAAYHLVGNGWNEPGAIIQLRDNLPLEELAESHYYHNAMALMRALDEEGGAKATARKNLNRSMVERMTREMRGERIAESLTVCNPKNRNETDIWPIHFVRVLLEAAKLIRLYKGKFQLTKLGRQFLDPARAGALQAHLFTAFVRSINIAYLDRAPEYAGVQATYPFILFAVRQIAAEEVGMEEFAQKIFLPAVEEEFEEHEYFSDRDFVARIRVAEPLADFGLLTIKTINPEARYFDREETVRITPLFDRMIRFDFENAAAADY